MNAKKIFDILKRDPECSKIFHRVYPADKIPTAPSLLALTECNTDTSSKPGEHWVILHIDKNRRGDYFDSFGRCPTQRFTKYLSDNCVDWTSNERQIQSVISRFCVHNCIFLFVCIVVED